jgi:hypothetical protein
MKEELNNRRNEERIKRKKEDRKEAKKRWIAEAHDSNWSKAWRDKNLSQHLGRISHEEQKLQIRAGGSGLCLSS